MNLSVWILFGVACGITATPFLDKRSYAMPERDVEDSKGSSEERDESRPCAESFEKLLGDPDTEPAERRQALKSAIYCARRALLQSKRLIYKNLPRIEASDGDDDADLERVAALSDVLRGSKQTLRTIIAFIALLKPVTESIQESVDTKPKRNFEDFSDLYDNSYREPRGWETEQDEYANRDDIYYRQSLEMNNADAYNKRDWESQDAADRYLEHDETWRDLSDEQDHKREWEATEQSSKDEDQRGWLDQMSDGEFFDEEEPSVQHLDLREWDADSRY